MWARTLAVAVLIPVLAGAGKNRHPETKLKETRADLIARAQVWMPTDVPSMDLLRGPTSPDGFAPGATVACDYVKRPLDGNSPKFACELSPDDVVKVKYGGTNGEVYGEVLATRLLWALGFGADHMYSVRVICRGCPAGIGIIDRGNGERLVDPAAIERKMPGREIESGGAKGWAWRELEAVREDAGGAPRAHRDALKLLAAFMQHTDSKPEQQRLLCLDKRSGKGHPTRERCASPFLMLNDVGLTFGSANLLNADTPGAVDLVKWSKVPVWKPGTVCTALLRRSASGTLEDPVISEAGRAFLARLLSQLSDAQLHDLFTAARVQLRPRDPSSGRSGFPTVDEWVQAFKAKRAQIVDRRCA